MASSYSTNLALTLPVQGELSGTWGTAVNTGITNMVDEALGYQAYSATGGADTLTIPDGSTGVARSIYIQLNGTGGGSVAVPTTKTKMYFVFNNTSSAITFKVTGQTGVSIPAAAKMALVSNGTDIIVAENYFAALTLGAALPVASGGTGLTAGTSGGIPAYTATGTLTSSGVLAQYGVVIGGGAGAVPTSTAVGTATHVLTSNGAGVAPTFQALPAGGVTTFNAGTTGFTPNTATTGAVTLAGTLAVANGGTNITSYAVGDIIFASTTGVLSKLADVATGNALISGGTNTAPSYGKIGLTTHVSGTLPIANGGTNGTATPTANGVTYGTGTTIAYTAAGTTGQVLTATTSGAPTWAASSSTANLQTFVASGTWTKPAGVTFVQVCVWGAGGGGGSGRVSCSGGAKTGGTGGGGGARARTIFAAACLTATVTVTVGNGGTGGGARSGNQNGLPGGIGGTSSFGCYLKAYGGGIGQGGTCGANTGGGGGGVGGAGANCLGGFPRNCYFGYSQTGRRDSVGGGGGASSSGSNDAGSAEWGGGAGGGQQTYTGKAGGSSIYGGAGGGAGSFVNSSTAGAGGAGGLNVYGTVGGGGAAGNFGASRSAGTAGTVMASGSGSGGGGGGSTDSGGGSVGGAGGAYGGGGGGGGAAQYCSSGAGGAGGAGGVKVYSW